MTKIHDQINTEHITIIVSTLPAVSILGHETSLSAPTTCHALSQLSKLSPVTVHIFLFLARTPLSTAALEIGCQGKI